MDDRRRPEVRWLERGDGAPVVLLHGLMGGMHDWDLVLDVLGEGTRALAPGLPMFDPALADVSIAGLARWTLGFLDALGLERVVLGGHALGGQVAVTAASIAPARVSALILSGAWGLGERSFVRRPFPRLGRARLRERMEEVFFDRGLVTAAGVEAVHRSVREPAVARRLVRIAGAGRRDRLDGRLGTLRVPTLLLWGREDRVTPLDVALRFKAAIHGATLIVLRDCGHATMIERPEPFGLIASAWLEATQAARALS